MIGRIAGLAYGLNGKQLLTLELDEDFRQGYDELNGKVLDVVLKIFRRRRSLDANAYAWVLIDKIAAFTGADKVNIYREAIRHIGGVSEVVCVMDEAVDRLRRSWERNGTGWHTETLPSRLAGCTNVILYFGSSTYDTAQMSALIDRLVGDAKELGIETATPEQIENYKNLWEVHNNGRNEREIFT